MQPGIDLLTNPQAKVQVAIGGPKRVPTQDNSVPAVGAFVFATWEEKGR